VEGRSGGGLFSADGLVIGVCNAADPMDHEGFYAALGSIQEELDNNQLTYIYQSPTPDTSGSAPKAAMVAVQPPSMPKKMPRIGDVAPRTTPTPPMPAPAGTVAVTPAPSQRELDAPQQLVPSERAALDELRRRQAEGAEVVIIVRSRTDPRAKSEIFVLDQVSPAFLEGLAKQVKTQDARRLTSLDVPRRAAQATSAQEPPAQAAPIQTSTLNLEGTPHYQPRR
jgi:hypothetical protein